MVNLIIEKSTKIGFGVSNVEHQVVEIDIEEFKKDLKRVGKNSKEPNQNMITVISYIALGFNILESISGVDPYFNSDSFNDDKRWLIAMADEMNNRLNNGDYSF